MPRGKLCIHSGSHAYNLLLFGAVAAHPGDATTEQWLKGMMGNTARAQKGGDTNSGSSFKRETTPVSVAGANQVKVQQMLDRVGFK